MRLRLLFPVLACCCLLLSGCVYLRLLELKGQFADFDRHLEVRTEPALELRFLHPPLLAEDVATLIGARPTAVAAMEDGAVWTYAFTRIPPPDEGGPAVPRILLLSATIRGGRLVAVTFPPQVSVAVPPALAVAALRSLGRASVDRTAFSATSTVSGGGAATALPDRARLVQVLGRPSWIEPQDGGGERLVYRYRLHAESLGGQPVTAAVAFLFPAGAERPARFSANIAGKWLYLDLPRE